MAGLEVEDKEWVEHCLKDYERKRCISKVLAVASEDAVPQGNNYASELHRVKMKVVLHSGEVEERHLIFKTLPRSPIRRKAMKSSPLFTLEGKVYLELFPAIDDIRRNQGDQEEPFWPKCYDVRPKNEGFLFEDLCVTGFKMANRMKGMDFAHAELAVKTLAKFHALSAIAIERLDFRKDNIGRNLFANLSGPPNTLFNQSFLELANMLEHKWQGEWVEYAERVLKFRESFKGKVIESFKEDESKFYTVNHGDCWLNNMMFQYDADGSPKCVKFVDFQLINYGRPGVDLQHFFQSSLEVGIMKRKPELLRLYYDSLHSDLKRFGYDLELPTFEDIKEGYDKAAVFGLGIALAFRPLMMCVADDAPDMEEVFKKLEGKEAVSMSKFDFDGEDYIKTLQYALREGKEFGFL